MPDRQLALEQWLTNTCHIPHYRLEKLAGDASFRRYFRLHEVGKAFIAMDAPPPRENCEPFVAIAEALQADGLVVPQIYAKDLSQGFLLLSDFGDKLYLNALTPENALELYSRALDALAMMQSCRTIPGWTLPHFTADFMRKELELSKEWYLQRYLGLTPNPSIEKMLTKTFAFLAEEAASQPQVFMHRDYHSANLMVLPHNQVGILDFQDAFIGPVTYDLVSLLRDCYIDWPEGSVMQLVLQYKDQLHLQSISDQQFVRWFDLMGLQRHLKALLTFARKHCRDNDSRYLPFIPRTMRYLINVSARYPECHALHLFLDNEVMQCAQ